MFSTNHNESQTLLTCIKRPSTIGILCGVSVSCLPRQDLFVRILSSVSGPVLSVRILSGVVGSFLACQDHVLRVKLFSVSDWGCCVSGFCLACQDMSGVSDRECGVSGSVWRVRILSACQDGDMACRDGDVACRDGDVACQNGDVACQNGDVACRDPVWRSMKDDSGLVV